MMFCTLITIFTLVLITEQKVGFDRHGYIPLFCKLKLIPNYLGDVENKNISMLVMMPCRPNNKRRENINTNVYTFFFVVYIYQNPYTKNTQSCRRIKFAKT